MPVFREALRTKIIDKGKRLAQAASNIISPKFNDIGSRRQALLAFLRKGQNLIGFIQPGTFDPKKVQTNAQRYFNRLTAGIKRFIENTKTTIQGSPFQPSRPRFRMALNNLIDRSEKRLTDLAKLVIDREITPAQFRESVQREIRQLHLASVLIGVGGVGNISSNVIEIAMARTSKQLNFLNDFVQDIQEITDKQNEFTTPQADRIVRAAQRYASSAKAVASDAEREVVKSFQGDREDEEEILAMRILSSKENHCSWCHVAGTMVLCEHGWKSIETIKPGDMVYTTFGLTRVKKLIENEANDGFSYIECNNSGILTTPNHPFMLDNGGYVKAENLREDDNIMFYQNTPDSVKRNFLRPNPLNFIPHTGQVGIFPNISSNTLKLLLSERFISRVTMPPFAINFYTNISNNKINSIAPYYYLLIIFNANLIKYFSSLYLWFTSGLLTCLGLSATIEKPFHELLVFCKSFLSSICSRYSNNAFICLIGKRYFKSSNPISDAVRRNFLRKDSRHNPCDLIKAPVSTIIRIKFLQKIINFWGPLKNFVLFRRIFNLGVSTTSDKSTSGQVTIKTHNSHASFNSSAITKILSATIPISTKALTFYTLSATTFTNIIFDPLMTIFTWSTNFTFAVFANITTTLNANSVAGMTNSLTINSSVCFSTFNTNNHNNPLNVVYSLTLENYHNYIANGFVVSNCPELSGYWHSLDDLVPIGNTPCRSNCGCYHIFARASDIGPLPQQTENLSN